VYVIKIFVYYFINFILGIDVDGIHCQDIIAAMGQRYDIHPLVQADMMTIEQRTKLDVLDDALFLVCKLIYRDMSGSGHINTEQICFYLKENLLITVKETPTDLFDSIKSKIKAFIKYFILFCFQRSYSTRKRSYKKI
jgi:magnesium transporter